MSINEKIQNCFLSMSYGDAIGFLNENITARSDILKPFVFLFDSKVKVNAPVGQWSYITELSMIVIKSLVDTKKEYAVKVDYGRFIQELELWQYYRHGAPENFDRKLKAKKSYYQSDYYWEDKRGHGFSRIIPIVLTNKNFQKAEEEVYKNIIYINRHPQVTLTALVLTRTLFMILEKSVIDRDQLVQELKEYLIHLKLATLEAPLQGKLPAKYNIQFEKEKIQFMMELDRLQDGKLKGINPRGSREVLLRSIDNLWNLMDGKELQLEEMPKEEVKESLAITYSLWGAMNVEERDEDLKDKQVLQNMGEYIHKLRSYEVHKGYHAVQREEVDLFQLSKGERLKHPLLNVVKVVERKENDAYIFLLIETKSGTYHFLKKK